MQLISDDRPKFAHGFLRVPFPVKRPKCGDGMEFRRLLPEFVSPRAVTNKSMRLSHTLKCLFLYVDFIVFRV